MAINAGIVVRRIGAWLTTDQPADRTIDHTADHVVDARPVQTTRISTPGAGWGALDEWEAQQAQHVRKAGLDLIKFQSVNRGY
jgi:hypothetical protein